MKNFIRSGQWEGLALTALLCIFEVWPDVPVGSLFTKPVSFLTMRTALFAPDRLPLQPLWAYDEEEDFDFEDEDFEEEDYEEYEEDFDEEEYDEFEDEEDDFDFEEEDFDEDFDDFDEEEEF